MRRVNKEKERDVGYIWSLKHIQLQGKTNYQDSAGNKSLVGNIFRC